MSAKRPRTEKSDKSKQLESSFIPKNVFVSDNIMFKHSVIRNKYVISGHSIILADFEYVNLALIWRTSSLEYFVIVNE